MKCSSKMMVLFILLFLALCVSGCADASNDDDSFKEERIYLEDQIYELEAENEHLRDELRWHEEERHYFGMAIANLMYDGEYEAVEALWTYYREGVEDALEEEFGTKDMSVIIAYLEELSETVVGNCEICNKPVYADDTCILPDGVQCAHYECVNPDTGNKSGRIEKDE